MTEKNLVVTYLWCGDTDSPYDGAMLRLWRDSLRGPGRFGGDILVITNRDDLHEDGMRFLTAEMDFERVADFFYFRIHNHAQVPAGEYASILQLDMDMLATADVNPLFPSDDAMRVTWSNFAALSWEHARHIMPSWRYRILCLDPRTRRAPGVSACFLGCDSRVWHDYMDRWSRLMHEGEARFRTPLLREQSYLNLAWLKKLFPMKIVGRDTVQHGGWTLDEGVRMWHFPNVPDRLAVMEKKAAELGLPGDSG